MPDGWFYMAVLEAKNFKKKGGKGTRNAYVEVILDNKKFKTDVAWKSLHPLWKTAGLAFPIHVGAKGEVPIVDVIVWDKNIAWKDTFLGFISIKVNGVNKTQRTVDKWFKLMKHNKYSGEIHLKLRYINRRDIAKINQADFFEEVFKDADVDTIEGDNTAENFEGLDLVNSIQELIGNKGKQVAVSAKEACVETSKATLRETTKMAANTMSAIKDTDWEGEFEKGKQKLIEKKQEFQDRKYFNDKKIREIDADVNSSVIKRGYLLYQTRKSKLGMCIWKKYFYILTDKPTVQLLQYENSSTLTPNLVISFIDNKICKIQQGDDIFTPATMSSEFIVTNTSESQKEFLFELVGVEFELTRRWLFQAPTSIEQQSWFSCIYKILNPELQVPRSKNKRVNYRTSFRLANSKDDDSDDETNAETAGMDAHEKLLHKKKKSYRKSMLSQISHNNARNTIVLSNEAESIQFSSGEDQVGKFEYEDEAEEQKKQLKHNLNNNKKKPPPIPKKPASLMSLNLNKVVDMSDTSPALQALLSPRVSHQTNQTHYTQSNRSSAGSQTPRSNSTCASITSPRTSNNNSKLNGIRKNTLSLSSSQPILLAPSWQAFKPARKKENSTKDSFLTRRTNPDDNNNNNNNKRRQPSV